MRDTQVLRRSTRNIKKRFEVLPPKKVNKKCIVKKKISSISDIGNMQSIGQKVKSVIDWSTWNSASNTKNHLMSDGFLDVLQYKSSSVIKADANYSKDIGQMIASANNTTGFVASLLNYGNLFENKVVELLKKELGVKNTVYIGGNPRSDLQYQKTIQEMKKGTPVIFQANLRNYDNQTYGVSDIIIRSDWINRFLDVNALTPQEEVRKAPLLKGKYHYVVIDIKYKSLPLRSDGIHLRNDGNLKAYKSQLYIYTDAVTRIQGYAAPYAFILGSKWKYTKNGQEFEGKACFERLGKIDYLNLDFEYIEKTKAALQWLKDVRENDYDLRQYPLCRDELYPNMCNTFDFPFRQIKKTFAEKNNDLTLLWNVGPKQRRVANNQGIYSWRDEKCTSETLGMNGKVKGKIVDKILDVNRSETHAISPKFILNNFADWKNENCREVELYVDFETSCSVFNSMEDLPSNNASSRIFLIGAGYTHPKNGKWIYKSFIVNRLTDEEEGRICRDFALFVSSLKKEFKCKNILNWHFSHAETTAWKRAEKRMGQEFKLEWSDLLKVFMIEPITVKLSLNFSLKSLVKAFHAHGFIETHYDDLECSNGSDAAIFAYRANLDCEKDGSSFADHQIASEIIKYNEIDCKSLCDIMTYLRNNHIKTDQKLVTKKRKIR